MTTGREKCCIFPQRVFTKCFKKINLIQTSFFIWCLGITLSANCNSYDKAKLSLLKDLKVQYFVWLSSVLFLLMRQNVLMVSFACLLQYFSFFVCLHVRFCLLIEKKTCYLYVFILEKIRFCLFMVSYICLNNEYALHFHKNL